MKEKLSMILSMVIFGTIGIFVELIALPSGLIAAFRGITGALVILMVMLIKKHTPDFVNIKKKLWLLILSGVAIGFNWILLFEAYSHTGIPVATVCYYTAPVIVMALSPFILKEKLRFRQIVCILLALCGIVAVSGVLQGGASKIFGVALGLGAAVLYASVVLMNKFMGEVSSYEKTAIQLMSAGIVVLPYAVYTSTDISFNAKSLGLLLIVGIVHTGFAYLLYFDAVKKLKAQTVAIFSYIDPASAIILSAIIFMQIPKGFEIMGALLIMCGAFFSEINFTKNKRMLMTQANNLQKEILDILDSYLHKNDYKSAEKHLLKHLERATETKDFSTEILLRNELMGLYRKLGKRAEALDMVTNILNLIEEKNLQNNVGSATTYLNSATVYKAFGMPEKSITLFEKAKKIYEEKLPQNDERLGGLYNNMALTLVDLKQFDKAKLLNKKAIDVMKNKPLEIAITHLNMANASESEKGILEAHEEISHHLEKAKSILEAYENRDGYYAFVCEKCASVFGYFGDFLYDEELQSRARRIYEGT